MVPRPEVLRRPTTGDPASVGTGVGAGASNPSDPLLEETAAQVRELGHAAEITNCNQGAAEALGMGAGDTYTVTVRFGSEPEAEAAVTGFEAAGLPAIVAEVVPTCGVGVGRRSAGQLVRRCTGQ